MSGTTGMGFGMTVALKDAFTRTANASARSAQGLAGALRGVKGVAGQLWGAVPGLAKFAGIAGGLYAGVVKPLQVATEWEDNLHSLRALLLSLGKTPAEVSRMMAVEIEPTIHRLTKSYGIESKKTIEAYWAAFSAGAEDAIEATGLVEDAAKTFRGFNVELPASIRVATDAWDQYGRTVGTAADLMGKAAVAQGFGNLNLQEFATYMRELTPIATKVGFSWDDVSATFAALTRGSGDAASSATKLKALLTNLATIRGRPELLERLRFMGVSLTDADMKGRGLMGTLRLLKQAATAASFQRTGIEIKRLGLNYTAADLQGNKLARSSAEIAIAMENLYNKGNKQDLVKVLHRLRINEGMRAFMELPLEKRSLAIADTLRQEEMLLFNDAEALAAFTSLTKEGSKQGGIFDQIITAMGGSSKVLEDALTDAMETPGMKMARLRAEFEEMQLTVGKELMPVLMDVMKAMQKVDWKKVFEEIKAAIEGIGQAVSDALKNAEDQYTWFGKRIEKRPMFWSNPINWVIQSIGTAVGFDWETVLGDFGKDTDKYVLQPLYDKFSNIGEKLKVDWKFLTDGFQKSWGSAWDEWQSMADKRHAEIAAISASRNAALQRALGKVKWHASALWDSIWSEAVSFGEGFVQHWGDIGRDVGNAFSSGWSSASEWAAGVPDRLSAVGADAGDAFGKSWADSSSAAMRLGDWASEFASDVGAAIELALTAAWQGIKDAIEWLKEALGFGGTNSAVGLSDSIKSAAYRAAGKEVPAMAGGGVVTRPTFALIGEAGPEAVVPLSRRTSGSDMGNQAVLSELRKLNHNLQALVNRPVIVQMNGKEVAKLVTREQMWQGSAA